MSKTPITVYVDELTNQLWRYRERTFGPNEAPFDPRYSIRPNPPVFTVESAALNVLVPEDAEQAPRVRALVPESKRHKWFRSMKSSQALAASVFGNLTILNRVDCLADVSADDGGPAFTQSAVESDCVELEHDVRSLNEPRATSVDVLVGASSVVCVECKLTEAEVGRCSRPRLDPGALGHCNGVYVRQKKRKHRCALAERGIRYWDHIPEILTGAEWQADRDHEPCPLAESYQLVRNVLAACVDQTGKVNLARGYALLVYDARNPAFHRGPDGTFERLREHLVDPSLLRRCSWQSILKVLSDYDDLNWLVQAVADKYGLEAAG